MDNLYFFDEAQGLASADDLLKNLQREIRNKTLPWMECSVACSFMAKKCLAIDIGGSTLKAAIAQKDETGEVVLSKIVDQSLPGTDATLTEEEFFTEVMRLAGFTEDIDCVAVSFSHNSSPLPGPDAKIVGWCKELQVSHPTGWTVAEAIRHALGRPDLKVAVVNDSLATMLGTVPDHGKGAAILGVIVGTGFNICCEGTDSDSIVNTEIGESKAFPQTDIDKMLDLNSQCPGEALAEKMISGLYLESLIQMGVEKAYREGAISDKAFLGLSLRECDPLLLQEQTGDAAIVRSIIAQLADRSAFYVALCSAALINRQKDYDRVLIGMEGSVIKKMPGYSERYIRYLSQLLTKKVPVSLHSSGYACIKGVSKLVLK